MPQIASQFNHCPVLMDARHVSSLSTINASLDTSKMSEQQFAMVTGIVSQNSEYKPYEFLKGIAIINVYGALIHNLGWSSKYATGYDVIKRKLTHARHDPDVKGIFLKFHTPGGTVFGCPDTGDLIADCGKDKPVWTLSDDMAYSAGQWLHAQGTRRLVTQSGGLGSVGVLVVHANFEKALNDFGIEMTLVFDGKHKVDGNPYESLPAEVKTKIEADCKKTRGQFAAAVSRGTGLSVADVLNTEAECFTGEEAVTAGLADAVVSSNTILDEFIEFVNTPQSNQTGIVMDPNKDKQNAQGAEQGQKPDARAEERARIKGITTHANAEGRATLAAHLAHETDLSVEAAAAILGSSAKEATAVAPPKDDQGKGANTQSDGFKQAMASEQHPELSADGDLDAEGEDDSPEAQAAAMAASYKNATGAKK